jgi:hypothetical protein
VELYSREGADGGFVEPRQSFPYPGRSRVTSWAIVHTPHGLLDQSWVQDGNVLVPAAKGT